MKLKPDKMTSDERMDALIEGKQTDRVPVMLFAPLPFFLKNMGSSLVELYRNPGEAPDIAFRVQVLGNEIYQLDGHPSFFQGEFPTWAFGGEFRYPVSESQQELLTVRYPVQSEDDAWNLKLPDVEKSGNYPWVVKFSKIQQQHGLDVMVFEGEPLTQAALICSMERFLRWLKKKPEICHHLMRLVIQHVGNVVQHRVNMFGKDQVFFTTGSALGSDEHTTVEEYEQFGVPYFKEMMEKVLALGIKPYASVHICGPFNDKLHFYREIPFGKVGIFSITERTDLRRAVEILGDKHIIMGNISARLLLHGSFEKVYEETRKCIETGKTAKRGFIMASACQVSPMTPPANVWAMRKAVDDFGWYE